MNVNFYCRRCKVAKNGTAPLEIAININGKRKFVQLPYRTTPEEFKKKRQPKELVGYMSLMRTRINEIMGEMLRNEEPLSTESLVEYLKNGGYKSYSVSDLFSDYLAILKPRVGKNLTPGVYRKYELVRDLFFETINSDRECQYELTHANVLRFKVQVESKYKQATAAGYLRKLKSYIYFAIDNGKLSVNPFQGIKIKRGENEIKYLAPWEQQAIMSVRLDNESLDRVRDCAVFQMNTGVAYADLKAFRKEDLKCRDGVYYIEKPRKKTGKVFTAVVLKPALEILKKYDGNLPVISNEKMNAYLKCIQDISQIKTTLTTHVFRRTYSMSLLNAGASYDVVAAAMGHSVKVCQKYYARLKSETVIKEISKII